MLSSGMLFGCVTSILVFMSITGGFINPANVVANASASGSVEEATLVPLLNTTQAVNESTSSSADSNQSVTSAQLFRITPVQSQASFSVYETFPEGTAIGRTREVTGDIIVDFENPVNSQVGVIRVNLRTLRTNDLARDRSIRCCVLLTARDEYEFAEFQPTAIGELPNQVVFGEPVSFQVMGDLSLRGATRSVTFDVELTVHDDERLTGTATTSVNRRDFGILNNDDNGFDYHGVANEVLLSLDFVANAVAES